MERIKKILMVSLPIMAGMMSQNVLNLVDIAMVGRLGPESIAAVGVGGLCSFLCAAYIIGFSSAVQAMSARRLGEGRMNVAAIPLNGGLTLAMLTGIPMTVLLYFLTPHLFPYINHDPEVVRQGIPYLQSRLIASTAMGMNFSFSGFWNGTNRSKYYMVTIITINTLNVFFNWVFIFGHLGSPAYGSLGAGIASTVSIICGTFVHLALGLRHASGSGFLKKKPGIKAFKTLIRLSVPTAIQHTFYAGGLLVVIWIIGLVGTMELAASQVITMLLLVGILPGIGLGLGATSLVSQALGRKDPDDAERWGWEITLIAVFMMILIGAPMLLIPKQLLALFCVVEEVVKAGTVPLQLTGIIIGVEAVMIICSRSLMGAGDNTRVMITSVMLQWLLYLPMAYAAGPVMDLGLPGIWLAQLIYKAIGAVVFALMWRSRKWEGIKI